MIIPIPTRVDTSNKLITNDAQLAVDLANAEMAYNAFEAQKSRDFNAEQAQINRDWQELMSNTALERQYKQYKSLGLNPYAMLSHGGASTPSGSSASSSPASYSGFASAYKSSSSSEHNAALSARSNERIAFINGIFRTLTAFGIASMSPIKSKLK